VRAKHTFRELNYYVDVLVNIGCGGCFPFDLLRALSCSNGSLFVSRSEWSYIRLLCRFFFFLAPTFNQKLSNTIFL